VKSSIIYWKFNSLYGHSLKFIWGLISQRRVQSFLVIYFFNEKGRSLLNILQDPIFPKIDFLAFEGLDKAFNKGIVIRISSAKRGRKIVRLPHEERKEKLEAQYREPASQEIYARRKARVEHPFGHIKRNLKTDAFLMRGRDGAGAETGHNQSCFDVRLSLFSCQRTVYTLEPLPCSQL
jgi:hypothetical protein